MVCLSGLPKTEILHFWRVAGLIALTTLAACRDDPTAPPRAATLTIAPESAKLTFLGQTTSFTAAVKDQNGAAYSGKVSWSSSQPDVFTVGPDGVVTAVANGSGSVMATFENLTATATVTVAQEPGVLLAVSGDGQRAGRGTTLPEAIVVRVIDTGGSSVEGATIAFTVGEGHGQANPATTESDSVGMAQTAWTLGEETGSQTLTVTAANISVKIEAIATGGGNEEDRDALIAFFDATGGESWKVNENWKTDEPLGFWYGVTVDDGVVGLSLSGNNLTGEIPAKLGEISNLKYLDLDDNSLTGEIPAELGELGQLWDLDLSDNELTGEIPAELGELGELWDLDLSDNELTGEIPAELGQLPLLERLDFSGNELTGKIPAELGELGQLWHLNLSHNTGMAGALPEELTRINLKSLILGGTKLCAPRDEDFQAWLDGIPKRRVILCDTGADSPVPVYLTQAVQSMAFPVPLVAGDPALLRVFVTAKDAGNVRLPPVRATFYSGGREHVADIAEGTAFIPADVDEGNLSTSANVEIPASVIAPGAEMVVEIDPGGTLDPALGIPSRIPETGRTPLDVHTLPVLDFTLVPFIWQYEPADSSIVKQTNALTPEDPMLHPTWTLLPVGDLKLTIREPLWTSHEPTVWSGFSLLRELQLIRTAEGDTGYYMGVLRGGGGMALLEGYLSVSGLQPNVIAHELGHNLSLLHAPCGDPAGTDSGFPYPGGNSGVWGYDFQADRLVSPSMTDVMSYCGPPDWISDFHFANALRFRLNNAGALAAQAPERVLLLWGGTDADDKPFLEPAFVTNAPPSLPVGGGSHRITGRNGAGDVLFSVNFDMHEIVDGDGGASFVFGLPARPEWAGALASITLAGPGGSAILDGNSDRTAALVRNTVTGRVRGIFRDWSTTAAQAGSGLAAMLQDPNLEIQVSRGIPDASAWQR